MSIRDFIDQHLYELGCILGGGFPLVLVALAELLARIVRWHDRRRLRREWRAFSARGLSALTDRRPR